MIGPGRDDGVRYDEEGRAAFTAGSTIWQNKFVVMYAGNHSPCNPLRTLLESADALKTRDDILFLFAGGGSALSEVRTFAEVRGLTNIRCLSYQPLRQTLGLLLSSADLHVVVTV